VGGAEVGAVAAEGLDPLGACVVDVVGDEVGGVALAAAGHRDVQESTFLVGVEVARRHLLAQQLLDQLEAVL
jgi:hypothetical protein